MYIQSVKLQFLVFKLWLKMCYSMYKEEIYTWHKKLKIVRCEFKKLTKIYMSYVLK